MKFKAGPLHIAILCIAIFFSSMLGYIMGVNASKSREISLSDTAGTQAKPLPVDYSEKSSAQAAAEVSDEKLAPYVLREHNGTLALFSRNDNGEEKLWQTYDIAVSLLPEADRKQLKDGINLSSISDALKIIEDFSS